MSRRRSFEVPELHHDNPIPMGCRIGPFVMTSGIFGMDPETRMAPNDIEGQCRLMFANVRRVMEVAGGSTDDIIKMVVWTKDKSFKDVMNNEWLMMFPDPHSRPGGARDNASECGADRRTLLKMTTARPMPHQ